MENINSRSQNFSEQESANPSIKCSVSCCEYHCGPQNYCTLDTVSIGAHEPHPTNQECVDCQDFVLSPSQG